MPGASCDGCIRRLGRYLHIWIVVAISVTPWSGAMPRPQANLAPSQCARLRLVGSKATVTLGALPPAAAPHPARVPFSRARTRRTIRVSRLAASASAPSHRPRQPRRTDRVSRIAPSASAASHRPRQPHRTDLRQPHRTDRVRLLAPTAPASSHRPRQPRHAPMRTRARASPSTISSPDSRRRPRDPAGTTNVRPFLTMLVPCALRSSRIR
jgi:hypothetical protein